MAKKVDTHSIAIIEYEERLAGLLTQFFHIKGFNISFIAYNENDALSSLLKSDPMPGIVILDHRTDVMDGLAIMREMHRVNRDINIIFLGSDQYIEEDAISSGAAIFLKKPVNLADIDNAILEIFSRSLS